MTRYANGRRLEYVILKQLRASGWWVMRSAGSHGIADLVAIRRNENGVESHRILFVSCKLNSRLSKAEANELISSAQKYNVIPALTIKKANKWYLRDLRNSGIIEI